MLSVRLEVRIDERTLSELRREATRLDVSVGELVRRGIDRVLETDRTRRRAAAEALCAIEVDLDLGDWETAERELVDSMYEPLV